MPAGGRHGGLAGWDGDVPVHRHRGEHHALGARSHGDACGGQPASGPFARRHRRSWRRRLQDGRRRGASRLCDGAASARGGGGRAASAAGRGLARSDWATPRACGAPRGYGRANGRRLPGSLSQPPVPLAGRRVWAASPADRDGPPLAGGRPAYRRVPTCPRQSPPARSAGAGGDLSGPGPRDCASSFHLYAPSRATPRTSPRHRQR